MQSTGETSGKHAGRLGEDISVKSMSERDVYSRSYVRQMDKSAPVKESAQMLFLARPLQNVQTESFSCHAAVQEEKGCHCRSVAVGR